MPLTRANVTVASRLMLPTYPILSGLVGLNYLVATDRLLAAGVFYRVADQIVPLQVWGTVFLVVAAIQVIALVSRSRLGYEVGLTVMAGSMMTWALVGLAAAVRSGGSYTATLWPAFVVVACVASFRSLNTGERS
jgi:hypothetical protein